MLTATAASLIVGLHLGTYHFDRSRRYEECNPGISLTVDDLTAGIYRNSEGRASVYGAWVWRPHRHLDVAFGGVTGYRRASVLPLIVPSTKVGKHARLSLLLPLEKGGGGVHLSWEF